MTKYKTKRNTIKFLFFVLIPILIVGAVSIGLYMRNRVDNESSDASSPINYSVNLKVLNIRYLPQSTVNPEYLDCNIVGPDLCNTKISDMRTKTDAITEDLLVKMKNASAYRKYNNSQALPFITYSNITSTIEYLERLPRSNNQYNPGAYRPDYIAILNRENICNWVDNYGVKEVWLHGYHYRDIEPAESNMAMGTRSRQFWNWGNFGDVSNSERINDMPVCENTYVLYNYNYGRVIDTYIEDHTHQLEAILRYADQFNISPDGKRNIFSMNFIGPVIPNTGQGTARCGWTHYPPNGERDYDWNNPRFVSSDCMDWTPEGVGQTSNISCETWGGAGCPDDGGVKFKIWWMQNLPGLNNGLNYKGVPLLNWWEYKSDFDEALAVRGGLLKPSSFNSGPVANNDIYTINSNIEINLPVIENDLDADLDNIQVIAITQPSRGIVEIRNNNIYFTPTNWPVGQQIETSFSYKISDGKGREDIGMVNLQGSILGSGGQNQAPVVNAGNDQRISATSANLIGTVTDDDLPNPPASLTNTWTKISGPGTVTFSNVNALSTNVTFSISGNYTLRLTASDSILSSSDDVVITVINEQVSTPQFSPDSGIYPSMQIVTISTQTQGATIRYTVDGSDPTENSVEYNVPLYMTTTMTLKARAYKAGMTASPVVSAHYIINNSGSTSDLVIYAKGTRATGDVTATSICQNGYPNMVVKYDNVEIGRRCLDATYPSGGYSYTIDTANANASKVTIHFTNDFNVVGLEDRNMIIEKIILNGTQTVLPSNLVYTKGQWTPTYGCGLDMERPATYSNRLGCNGYMRLRQSGGGTPPPSSQVANPSIDPNGTTFTSSLSVSITTNTSGAVIRYTTNGSDPTESSALYTIPLTINTTTIIKARAYKSGMTSSSVVSRIYTKSTGGGTSYCVPYNLNSTFDNRDGVTNTLNRVKLTGNEIGWGYSQVNKAEIISDFAPGNTSGVTSCWSRVVNVSNNTVACSSNKVYCTWTNGRAIIRGHDPLNTNYINGCRLPVGTYRTETFLRNSSNTQLARCDSNNFSVTSN